MNYIKEFKFTDYQSPKTKVLSVRIEEKLFNEFNEFKKEFKELTGCHFYFSEVVAGKMEDILNSYKDYKNEK